MIDWVGWEACLEQRKDLSTRTGDHGLSLTRRGLTGSIERVAGHSPTPQKAAIHIYFADFVVSHSTRKYQALTFRAWLKTRPQATVLGPHVVTLHLRGGPKT